MISALKWVPRGAAQANPSKYDLNEEEFDRIQAQIGLEMENIKLDIDNEVEQAETRANETDEVDKVIDELAEYNMDTYSDDEGLKGIPVFGSVNGLTYHEAHDNDPYITVKETPEEEMRELEILPGDNLLLACRTEDEVSHLEVYVYEEEEDK